MPQALVFGGPVHGRLLLLAALPDKLHADDLNKTEYVLTHQHLGFHRYAVYLPRFGGNAPTTQELAGIVFDKQIQPL